MESQQFSPRIVSHNPPGVMLRLSRENQHVIIQPILPRNRWQSRLLLLHCEHLPQTAKDVLPAKPMFCDLVRLAGFWSSWCIEWAGSSRFTWMFFMGALCVDYVPTMVEWISTCILVTADRRTAKPKLIRQSAEAIWDGPRMMGWHGRTIRVRECCIHNARWLELRTDKRAAWSLPRLD